MIPLKSIIAFLLVIAAALLTTTHARNYAVLVAGSFGFFNYRHQADIAHHYQNLKSRGFLDSDIITFMYDDLVKNPENPFPGATFNEPDDGKGINNYLGLKIDYSGKSVTPENFLNALVGNNTGIGPVLNTGPDDNILIFMDDHGAPGLFAFPTTELYVKDFKNALDEITLKRKAAKVLVYIEACESGSLCEGNVIPSGSPIVCMTASDDELPSYGQYCGPEATINGQNIGSCLANEFSIATSSFIDQFGVGGKTLGDHYDHIKKQTTRSPAQFFAGDISFRDWKLTQFWSQIDFDPRDEKKERVGLMEEEETSLARSPKRPIGSPQPSSYRISCRDNELFFLFQTYLDSQRKLSFEERIEAGEELLEEIMHRLDADRRWSRIAESVLSSSPSKYHLSTLSELKTAAIAIHTMESDVPAIDCGTCCENAFKMVRTSTRCQFSDYTLKFAKTIHNLCTIDKNNAKAVMAALEEECGV